MTPKEAKRELSSIRRLDGLKNSVLRDAVKTKMDMQQIRAVCITDMPRGGVSVTLDDILVRYEELAEKQAKLAKEFAFVKAKCIERIERIETIELRQVLYERYLNYLTWEAVADVMNYEVRQVYRMHGRALREFAEADDVVCR